MDIDAILADSIQKYPNGTNALENELRTLKRNLNVNEGFTCDICKKIIQHRTNFNRHLKSHETTYKCFLCNRKFTRIDSLKRHERGHLVGYVHPNDAYNCQHCGLGFKDYTTLFDHSKTMHPVQIGGNANISNHKTASQSALDDSAHVLTIHPSDEDRYDLLTFFSNIRQKIKDTLEERCDNVRHVKWYLNVHVELTRETNDGEIDNSHPYFKSKTYILLFKDDINDDEINEAFQKQFKSFDEYMSRGSGWTLKHVINMELHTIQFRPTGGSTYFKIPETLEKGHAVVNIKNNDNKCFLWSILACLHPKSNNPNRLLHYVRYEKELNMKGISYPVHVKQIPKFENQNDISVNVFGFEEGEFFPIHISKHKTKRHEVDLLYLTKNDGAHYCYIKHLNRLLSRTKNSGRAYKFCRYCLRGFTSQKVLEKHLRYCSKQEAQHVEFPVKGSGEDLIEFDDFAKQMRVPFVIYCDFEAFARPLDTCLPNPSQSSTTATVSYEACGYGYQVVCEYDQYSKPPVIYRGSGACQHLLKQLFKEEEYIKNILDKIEPLNMTPTDERTFNESTCCHICKKPFTTTSEKVRDHSHLTGRFRGAAHNSCNLNYQYPDFIPVYFHNLRGFDSHLLMQGVGLFKGRKINCIPNNMERYVSFSLGSLRFVDSFQCLQSSLSNLVDDLVKEDPQHFKALIKEFPSNEQSNLLLRKGVDPYTYMDREEKFSMTCLPSKENFYNDLTKSHISEVDYDHAKKVWNAFKLCNMGEYHDLYLKSDVLLLNFVFLRHFVISVWRPMV